MFQARKWGWKRIAARLLLVPVLAGGSATIAKAQTQTSPTAGGSRTGGSANSSRSAGTNPSAPVGNPKAMLKEGRKALVEGRFNEARDLAQRAEASNPTGKWGLFEDTPNALRKDIDAAQAKAKQAEVERLVKQAKGLLGKSTRDNAERTANLDTALKMARQADQLHGPTYSVWDFGDRPDKLVKEIESVRSKLKPLPTPPNATAGQPGSSPTLASNSPRPGQSAAGVQPAAGNGGNRAGSVTPAGGSTTAGRPPLGLKLSSPTSPADSSQPVAGQGPSAPASADPKKAAALKLMAEGKQLADRGDFAGAHAKYTEAGKAGATFSEREYGPGFALQELNARGAAAIDRLVKEAQTQMGKKDYAKADAALTAASDIATALSLFPRPIEEAKTALRLASGGKHGGVPPGGLAAAGGPEKIVPVGGPVAPSMPSPPGVAKVAGPAAPTLPDLPGTSGVAGPVAAPGEGSPAVATSSRGATGRQLLDQAALELRKGDFELARRLALQAHNLGESQAEARGLLNQIDAEVFAAKQRTATKSYEAAVSATQRKDFGQALGVLVLIDSNLLPPDMRPKREELIATCKAELDKAGHSKPDSALATAGGMQPPAGDLQPMADVPPGKGSAPGMARVGTGADSKPSNPDSLTNQVDAMRKVTFQKLRSEGLKVQADAQAAFGRGETDVAIQMLSDYSNRVRAASLDAASVAMLLRPVDSRMEMFRVMKGQADAVARQNREKKEAKELLAGHGAADEQRKAEVQRLVRQYHELVKKSDFAAAERVAMQAKQLEPDDPAISALAHMAKVNRRVRDYDNIKSQKEEMVLKGLNSAEKEGPFVDTDAPVSLRLEHTIRARNRGSLDDVHLKTRTPAEYEIELKLDRPISVEFNQTPMSEAIESIRTLTGLPISYDSASLEAEGISTAKPISEKLTQLSTRNALYLILDKLGLSYVIEYDTVRITTVKKAKGRLFTKVFSVADLVTPIPNFALPDYANFDKMLNKNALNSGQAVLQGLNTPGLGGPRGGLPGGTLPGAAATTPGVAGGMTLGSGGSLENSPLSSSATLAPDRGTKHEQLIKLVTSMIRPYSWEGMGGAGKVEYFDIGSALVVNQTADVIREIQDLLESLRRLQDLAVAVEVRIISLSESWFERMGVNFSMNINTHNTRFEPQLTTQQFTPEPFVNSIRQSGTTVGLTPAGSFTPDLGVPIRSSSFNYAIPEFGGYPNNPGFDGGLSLGLAFLNDIQVYMFMEAAQGDRRVNVMQAPKLTLFNGQTATIGINNPQFLVTNVQVFSVNGQIVFIPQNTPLPGPSPLPVQQAGSLPGNINMSLQAVVSADRRFVRINIPITMAAQTGATIPLFPFTTFVTPVFEGGSQGVPIPFTQFLQQPAFTTLTIQTTVVCPDGGTVLLGGLKTLGESRNEFGPPFLSKVPYVNRLFKNVGIGRETQHVMIMITPRIIINSEEEITQTEGGGAPLGVRPGQ